MKFIENLLATSVVLFAAPLWAANVNVSSPKSGATVASPFSVLANCGIGGANAIQVYLDGNKIQEANGSSINQAATAAPGTHELAVKCWAGSASYILPVTIHVQASPVQVSAPVANSVVGPQFNVVANCAAGGTNGINAYLDGQLIYNSSGTSMNAQVSPPEGSHQLEVKCWAGSTAYSSGISRFTSTGTTGFDGSPNIPNPPNYAINPKGIQMLSNWTSATGAVSACPDGVPSPTCNAPVANYSPVVGHPDGSTGIFDLYQSPSWATVIWGHSLVSAPAVRNFIWDFNIYVSSNNYYSSELDLYTSLNNGQRFMMGTQCNQETNSWDTWNEATQKWISNYSIPCKTILTPFTWHHVSLYMTVNASNNTYTYKTFRIDNKDYVLNQTQPAKYVGWPDGLIGVQMQLDANGSGAGVSERMQNMQLFAW